MFKKARFGILVPWVRGNPATDILMIPRNGMKMIGATIRTAYKPPSRTQPTNNFARIRRIIRGCRNEDQGALKGGRGKEDQNS